MSKPVRIFWGIGDAGFQMMVNIESVYFIFFLSDVAKFPVTVVTIVALITSISDFICAPLGGMIINISKPMRWGKIRSWLLVTPPAIIVFFTLQFTYINHTVNGAILVVVGYICGHFIWNIAYAANVAVITLMSHTSEERMHLNSNRIIWFNIGRIINSYAVAVIVTHFRTSCGENPALYSIGAFCTSLVMMLGYYAHFKMSEAYVSKDQMENKVANDRLNIKEILGVFSGNKNLVALMLADLTSNISQNMTPALAIYYYKYVAQNSSLLATQLLLNAICGMLGAWTIGKINGKSMFSKKKTLIPIYMILCAILIVARISAFHVMIFLLLNAFMQFISGMTQPIEADMYMDVATFHEYKTGKNATGFIVGLMSVPSKMSVILKSLIISIVLMAVHYVPDETATSALQVGIVNACFIVPPVQCLSAS